MINSGVSLLEALEHLSKDESMIFTETIKDLIQHLVSGHSLSSSIRKHPSVFPKISADLIEAGEKSGALHKSFDRLADYLSRSSYLEKRFKAAMVYPAIILLLMFTMLLVMVWFVFPREQELLASMGAEMPMLTRLLFDGLGYLFHPVSLGLAAVSAIAFYTVYTGGRSGHPLQKFRLFFDTQILKVPMLGNLVFKFSAARVLSVFGTLLESGASVDQSMHCSAKMMGNVVLEERLEQAQRDLLNGEIFSDALELHDVFPPLAVHLFRIAEESGGLPTMAGRLAKIFEDEVEDVIDTMASLVEPAALLIMGGFVGLVLLATLLPTANVIGGL